MQHFGAGSIPHLSWRKMAEKVNKSIPVVNTIL